MTETTGGLLIAKGAADLRILPHMASRHGLVAGATGTGKTVTLQMLAEAFSSLGVPVFAATSRATSRASLSPAAATPASTRASANWVSRPGRSRARP
jgi:hypothetical protein